MTQTSRHGSTLVANIGNQEGTIATRSERRCYMGPVDAERTSCIVVAATYGTSPS
jgi:hypothetical protein